MLEINNKNVLGWLRLLHDITDDDVVKKKLYKYLNRTDTIHRQKELDDIFGGEKWLI